MATSIHASLERYYRSLKEKGVKEPLGVLLNYFEHHINLELDQTDIPIVFKKETPDRDAVIDMGNAMLEAFHEGVDLTGFEILEIERPLSARLYTDEGQPTDLKLIGVLDLVLKDEAGRIIAVDNKTASKPYAQATVDDDNQLTCYAYLLGGESVCVSHRRCPLPAGCAEKTQNAQAGALSHRPHGGSAPPVRQARHCRSRRNRSTKSSSPNRHGCAAIALTQTLVERGNRAAHTNPLTQSE